MPRKRKNTGISCTSTDCKNGLHCFRATKEMVAQDLVGRCRECGAELIDWPRVHQCNINDVEYTFNALKYERVRHHFWHQRLTQRAINHAKRKGKHGIRDRVRHHLEGVIGPAQPFHDGFQTTMDDQSPTAVPFGQHATATCCRKCVEYWHGIPMGRVLSKDELDYFTELVCLYIEDRIPSLTDDGERIPPIRKRS